MSDDEGGEIERDRYNICTTSMRKRRKIGSNISNFQPPLLFPPFTHHRRMMRRPSLLESLCRGAKRGPLHSKQGNSKYYKGSGTGAQGWHTTTGHYIADPYKIRCFVVPKMTNSAVSGRGYEMLG
jgi:hypothetical protein